MEAIHPSYELGMSYQGTRWFKCDLQVQTPEDGRHWADDDLRLPDPRWRRRADGSFDEDEIDDKARRFLRRCHELELDVIGVTDHNFAASREERDWFLRHLIHQNQSVAQEVGREPIWIFPGFEVDIGYHLLCLFAPTQCNASSLVHVNQTLSQLGLPESARQRVAGPSELRRDSAYVPLKTVLGIVQEERGGIVIAAHAFQKDGICRDGRDSADYLNEDLLAVEVSPADSKRAHDILNAKTGTWKRALRAPAAIMSSDAKSLKAEADGRPNANSLGYRYSWIKMSEPSIEALRQAFLDPESRIVLPTDIASDESPARSERHGRIVSLSVKGTDFLADQTIEFSPSLTCIIGGRGTGKSTLVEYLRLCLRRVTEKDGVTGDVRTQVDRLRATLPALSRLALKWRADKVEERFVFGGADAMARVEGREVSAPDAVFRSVDVQIFSQRQLSQTTRSEDGQPTLLLGLIDQLSNPGIDRLLEEEKRLVEDVRRLLVLRKQLATSDDRLLVLQQEEVDLRRTFDARSAVQAEGSRHRRAQEARQYLERVKVDTERTSTAWLERAQELGESHAPLGSQVKEWPGAAWFEALDGAVEAARYELAREVAQAVARFRQRVRELTEHDVGLPQVQSAIARAEAEFLAACGAHGLKPEEVSRLQEIDQRLKAKRGEVETEALRRDGLKRQIGELEALEERLELLWWNQWKCRQHALVRLTRGPNMPKVGTPERPFVDVVVSYMDERRHFTAQWQRLAPDGRTALGRSWLDLGDALRGQFRGQAVVAEQSCQTGWQRPDTSSPPDGAVARPLTPWRLLADWLSDASRMPGNVRSHHKALRDHLKDQESAWDDLRLSRIRDSVDVTLYRQGGERAGSLLDGSLSDGQRNTAVLALLLAEGTGPLVIDQPEEELDSDFLFNELVPMLRKLKQQRQLIVVTHNANLPVNGDAELVYALQADGGRGHVRAQGGLDRESVKAAVLDIMEGSAEAFRRRRWKYNS